MKNNSFIFSIGDLYYSCLDDTSVSVVENEKYMYFEHIIVPAHISYQGKEYNVTTIGKRAFHSCKCTSIVLTNGITTISERAFEACWVKDITIPPSITNIGYEAFYNTIYLKELQWPCLCTSIPTNAFYDGGLKRFIIPEGVTDIEGGVFDGCTDLELLVLPSTMERIAEQVFWNTDIRTIICFNPLPPLLDDSAFDYPHKGTLLFVPEQSVFSYKQNKSWNYWHLDVRPITKKVLELLHIKR